MKILYAIQGTGNGHVSRAREIIPHLKKFGKVDLLLSGTQAEVPLEDPIKYRMHGFGFVFGEDGGVDIRKTFKQMNTARFLRDIRSLPVTDYDAVIHDFEPVTAWACKLRKVKSLSLSHQSAFWSEKTPVVSGFPLGKFILKNYAPATDYLGFHFHRFDEKIFSPVIRREIRQLHSEQLNHYTVYLPAYSDKFILHLAKQFPAERWQIFSKHTTFAYAEGNASVRPISNEGFINSLRTCKGLLTGGGFEGPAEALYLCKKILVVPMSNQYEQQCNALALEQMGIPVIWKQGEFLPKMHEWVKATAPVEVNFPDETAQIVQRALQFFSPEIISLPSEPASSILGNPVSYL